MLLESSLCIMLVTIVVRLSSVIVHDFKACSLFWPVIINSDIWVLNSAWLVSRAVMRADILPDAACCTHPTHTQATLNCSQASFH